MRTSFHHQPEAQHLNFPAIETQSGQAEHSCNWGLSTRNMAASPTAITARDQAVLAKSTIAFGIATPVACRPHWALLQRM
jgi:hypothetical protein